MMRPELARAMQPGALAQLDQARALVADLPTDQRRTASILLDMAESSAPAAEGDAHSCYLTSAELRESIEITRTHYLVAMPLVAGIWLRVASDRLQWLRRRDELIARRTAVR